MALKRERPSGASLKELLSLESSVLKTLCLTINSPGSGHKDKILDAVTRDDFYFPIHKALFSILLEMNHRGDYIVLPASRRSCSTARWSSRRASSWRISSAGTCLRCPTWASGSSG